MRHPLPPPRGCVFLQTPFLRTGVSDGTPSASGNTFTFTSFLIHSCHLYDSFDHVDVTILVYTSSN